MAVDPSRVKPSVEQPMGPDTAPPADAALAAKCEPARVQDLVGKMLTPALQADAQVRSGARTVRAYGERDMVTMDYREDRLNIMTNAKGRVLKVICG